MQQLTSGTCSWRCRVGIFFEKDFFGKLDPFTIFILFVEEFFGKPGSQADDEFFFVLKKNFLESPGCGLVFFFLKICSNY